MCEQRFSDLSEAAQDIRRNVESDAYMDMMRDLAEVARLEYGDVPKLAAECTGSPKCGIDGCHHFNRHVLDLNHFCKGGCLNRGECKPVPVEYTCSKVGG